MNSNLDLSVKLVDICMTSVLVVHVKATKAVCILIACFLKPYDVTVVLDI